MTKVKTADLLVEIGAEELPPKTLRKLMQAFADNLEQGLKDKRLNHGDIKPYASPRRIAAIVTGLAISQDSRELELKGPPVRIAIDDDGKPTAAAIAFSNKCGVAVEDLGTIQSGENEWLSYRSTEQGLPADSLLPAIVEQALLSLPVARRMRWGASEIAFVRPVHWVVLLHGKKTLSGSVMGKSAGNKTRGHRFLSSGEIAIGEPARYVQILEEKGCVLVDFDLRQQKILRGVQKNAKSVGGVVLADDKLYEEVAALTEWPVVMTGSFDEAFLELPPEAITASLTGHQRYFPIADDSGKLLPAFVFVANIDSKDPGKVRDGNERVIRPRLADAAFFWRRDKETRLEDRAAALDKVVYQKGLGSLLDKSKRVADLCTALGDELKVVADHSVRAAHLAKCDLLTGMVGEFPELQGIMGRYYAHADGEAAEVANAIGEQYLPRFAGDEVPGSVAGQLLALADKMDTLAGIFALGKRPSGSKDPFALRRAALGIIRISAECGVEFCLRPFVDRAVRLQPVSGVEYDDVILALDEFIAERLRSFYLEHPSVTTEIFDAVNNAPDRASMTLPDFDQRIDAVAAFASMPEAEGLAAANKRISNILQQSADEDALDAGSLRIDDSLFEEPAENDLNEALRLALGEIGPLQARRDYTSTLTRLAALKAPVDRFFDDVLVMSDDARLKQNRLALLAGLQRPFLAVADISRLSVSKSVR